MKKDYGKNNARMGSWKREQVCTTFNKHDKIKCIPEEKNNVSMFKYIKILKTLSLLCMTANNIEINCIQNF